MKNAFDPKGNFNEWIQNDWESDDYIENHGKSRPVQTQKKATEKKSEAGYWILAVLIYFGSNPLFWFVLVAAIIWSTL